MNENSLRLTILLGSVREGRLGPAVADWFTSRVRARDGLAVDVIDLADHPLPLTLPGYAGALSAETAREREQLSARLAAADAFAVVTPEYNHTFPAGLKNFLDWFLDEWAAKPVGFVSYGGMGGGLRAVEHLRPVFAELHAVTVRDSVSFHTAWEQIGDSGLSASEASEGAAKSMLDQLVWWGDVLRRGRAESEYRR